jgi:hypothetical protein
VNLLYITHSISALDWALTQFLRETYGSASIITEPTRLTSRAGNVDAIILSPSVCQEGEQGSICAQQSRALHDMKTGVIATGSDIVWKHMGLARDVYRYWETQVQFKTPENESLFEFPPTHAMYSPVQGGANIKSFLQSSL